MSSDLDCHDGGSAFPLDIYDSASGRMITSKGMTLRDYFAAQALTALAQRRWDPTRGRTATETMAAACYNIADAMLIARNESKG